MAYRNKTPLLARTWDKKLSNIAFVFYHRYTHSYRGTNEALSPMSTFIFFSGKSDRIKRASVVVSWTSWIWLPLEMTSLRVFAISTYLCVSVNADFLSDQREMEHWESCVINGWSLLINHIVIHSQRENFNIRILYKGRRQSMATIVL